MLDYQLIADGKRFEFESPFDLSPERISILKRAGKRFCACRPEEHLRLSVVDGESGQIRPHIRCVDGPEAHYYECVFRRWATEGCSRDGRFMHSVFDPSSEESAADSAFSLWARRRIAQSYHLAFDQETGVETMRFFGHLERHSSEDFKPAISPFELAKRNGLRLVCGFAERFIFPLGGVQAPSPFWPIRATVFSGSESEKLVLRVPVEKLVRRLTAISVYGTAIEGPYMFVALVEQKRHKAVRIFLQPAAIVANQICTVDSGAERRAVTEHLSAGTVLYKPLSLELLNALPSLLRSTKIEHLEYRYRPDWLCFGEGIELWELCGFPEDRAYMQAFSEKAKYWQQLERAGHIRFRIARACGASG